MPKSMGVQFNFSSSGWLVWLIPFIPSSRNKVLMRFWTQFSERDRCSLGPDGLETWWQLDSEQVPCLWFEQSLSSPGCSLGRQHEDNQMEEQPLPGTDPLPGGLLFLSQSQERCNVTRHSSLLCITLHGAVTPHEKWYVKRPSAFDGSLRDWP